jgi:DNA-binding IclR family transcriptional regulator
MPSSPEGDCLMPTDDEIKVLKLLAKEWDLSGPPGILDVSDIVAALDLAPSETMQSLKTLFESGLVDMNSLKTSAFLTPEGYSAAKAH